MLYIIQALGTLISLILSLTLSPLSPILRGIILAIYKYREGISTIRNPTVIRWSLDAGLAGDAKARTRYDKSRVIRKRDVPNWTMPRIQAILDDIKRQPFPAGLTLQPSASILVTATLASLAESMAELDQRVEKHLWEPGSRVLKAKEWHRGHALNMRIARYMLAWMRLGGTRTLMDKLHKDIVTVGQQRYELFNERYDELLALLCASVWLEDFLSLHPCHLEEHEKQAMIRDCQDSWQLQEHPLIQRILQAESELRESFDRYGLTIEERSQAVYKLMRSTITKSSLRKVIEWAASRRLSAPPVRPTPVVPTQPLVEATIIHHPPAAPLIDRRKLVRSFVRGQQSLDRWEQNQIMHLILQMDNEGLASASELVKKLERHPAKDLLPYLELRYHELAAVTIESETPAQAIRPIVQPQLSSDETVEELLDRLAVAEQIDYADIPRLRGLITRGQLPPEQVGKAIAHLICFRLAHASASQAEGRHRPYRIRLDTLAKRYAPPGLEPVYEDVVARLVSDGALIHRHQHATRRPSPASPVKLAPCVMHKYRG